MFSSDASSPHDDSTTPDPGSVDGQVGYDHAKKDTRMLGVELGLTAQRRLRRRQPPADPSGWTGGKETACRLGPGLPAAHKILAGAIEVWLWLWHRVGVFFIRARMRMWHAWGNSPLPRRFVGEGLTGVISSRNTSSSSNCS